MRTVRPIFVLLLMTFALPALAEWVTYATGSDGDVYYYDPTTIKTRGEFVRVWEIADFAKEAGYGRSMRVLQEYDCKEERYRALSISIHTGHMAHGEVLQTITSLSWNYAAPNSAPARMLKLVCK